MRRVNADSFLKLVWQFTQTAASFVAVTRFEARGGILGTRDNFVCSKNDWRLLTAEKSAVVSYELLFIVPLSPSRAMLQPRGAGNVRGSLWHVR